MRGFDNKFKDFPDYIIGITKEIWEDRGMGEAMSRYYHPDVIVRMPGSFGRGEAGMTAATMATIVQFPDRTLLGQDVIWSGTPEDGMLSSHRILSTATHMGDGMFGPPTGRKIASLALADCYAKDNMISDEWLIRDSGGIVRQIGGDPKEFAAENMGKITPFTPDMDVDGPYMGRGNDNAWGAKTADMLTRLMQAEFSLIPEVYDRAVETHYAGSRTGHGTAAADEFWLGLRSAFPSAQFSVKHVIGREDPMMPPRAAVRWALDGTHDGWGAFGRPTGAKVHVMGITHVEYGPWGLRRDYTLYDEVAIWTQILSHTG
ncbi:ester cyclase [Nereida sp. MMG025]|uniref:nuclear transport factor 2 family protein n=1 Tax=Nereida sp. MMG025 TaxID=2909981 RepID=UPI001F21B38F|nr:ester cyclase [Nereida sp. MMG025]MCF6443855.1 ester cyclase [Nereida sp. MMG025]